MKHTLLLACLALATSHAAIVVPGANGTDGALNITANTEIDLSLAPTAAWDSDNTANAGKGVYDPAKWAVVFKYTSVTVAAGATVTFKNHPSRAPVVWLVSGNVTIAGTVKLDGQNGIDGSGTMLPEPGPGGSRGGAPWLNSSVTSGAGFGVGGASRNGSGKSASYGTAGNGAPPAYGNPSLIPLIGGSGGGGTNDSATASGGAGGGAILIAVAQTISIGGTLSCKGGDGGDIANYPDRFSGQGSGGGIRIVADAFVGAGQINTIAGSGGTSVSGNGRIRLERVTNTSTASVNPAPSVVDLAANATALLWPPADAPEVKIVSLSGVAAPEDPRAGFGTLGADVAIPSAAGSTAIIETRNVEQASQVKVRITPRDNADYTEVAATYSSTVSTTPLVIRWTATLPTNLGYSAVQVRVIRP